MKTVTFDQLLLSNLVARDKAYNVITEYNQVLKEYGTTSSYGDAPVSQDIIYSRKAVEVKPLTVRNLKSQFLDQLKTGGVKTIKSKKLDNAISKASKIIVDNYGVPQVLIKISNKKFVLADIQPETLRIKLLDDVSGCIISYRPKANVIIEIK